MTHNPLIQHAPQTLNPVPYVDVTDIEATQGGRKLLRNGIMVVVTITPWMDKIRYPNLIDEIQGTPNISNNDRKEIVERFNLLRQGKSVSTLLDVTQFVTGLSWSCSLDTQAINLEVELDNFQGLFNFIPEGSKITIYRRKGVRNISTNTLGKWYPYIVSFLVNRTRGTNERQDTMSWSCYDRAGFLKNTQGPKLKKVFKASEKKGSKGITPAAVTKAICKDIGFPIGVLPTSITTTVTKKGKKVRVTKKIPPLQRFEHAGLDTHDILFQVWDTAIKKMPKAYQRKFYIHARDGKINVDLQHPVGYAGQNQLLMFDDDTMINASLAESLDDSKYTVLKATGTIQYYKKNKKGKRVKHKKKVSVTVTPTNKEVFKALGKRHGTKNFGKRIFKSKSELKTAAQAHLDTIIRPQRMLKFDSVGVLGLWPMRYVTISNKYLGIKGAFTIKSINYTINEGMINLSIEMDVEKKNIAKVLPAYSPITKFSRF